MEQSPVAGPNGGLGLWNVGPTPTWRERLVGKLEISLLAEF